MEEEGALIIEKGTTGDSTSGASSSTLVVEKVGSIKPVVGAIVFTIAVLILFILFVWGGDSTRVEFLGKDPTVSIQSVASVFSVVSVISTTYLLIVHIRDARDEVAHFHTELQPGQRTRSSFLQLLLSLRRRRYVMRLAGLVWVYTFLSGIAVWNASNNWSVIAVEVIYCYEAFVAMQFYNWMVIQLADGTELPSLAAMTCVTAKSLLENERQLLVVGQAKLRRIWTSIVYQTRERMGRKCRRRCCCMAIQRWDFFWSRLSRVGLISWMRISLSLYVVSNLAILVIVSICLPLGLYKNGDLTLNNVYPFTYNARTMFLTVTLLPLVWSLICLREPLKSLSPVKKFATVKLIVFIGVWQRVVLTFMRKFHHVPEGINPDESVSLLNDSLMCLEMFVAVFINFRVFQSLPHYAAQSSGLPELLQELIPSSSCSSQQPEKEEEHAPQQQQCFTSIQLTDTEEALPGPGWYLLSIYDVLLDIRADFGLLCLSAGGMKKSVEHSETSDLLLTKPLLNGGDSVESMPRVEK